jgi:hypothetical protein
MILWIASYPKSGNTYIRSFIAAYYFSKKGKFDFDQLVNILQFPSIKFSKKEYFNFKDAASNWIHNQNYFFGKENFRILKTHNTLNDFQNEKFTTKRETLGAIYVVRDPRNIVTSMANHYSFSLNEAYEKLIDKEASLSEKSVNGDCSNFTFLGSWSEHYQSWRDTNEFKVLFIKYEDLREKKYEIFKEIINFIESLKKSNEKFDEAKFNNAINSTNFVNLKNKELNEKFDESVLTADGKRITFFNLGFKNKWQSLLSEDMIEKLNNSLKNELSDLIYI